MANTFVVLTRAYGLESEWGPRAVKAKTPSVPYLGSVSRTLSVALISGRRSSMLLQKLQVSPGANGVSLRWETTEKTDTNSYSLGKWYYQGEEIETEALALMEPEAVNNAAYLVRETDDVPALGGICWRQHTISVAREHGSYQLNEPSLWVPGNPNLDHEAWGPAFIEAMVSGIGPWNVKAFERFRDIVREIFGVNPLRVYRSGEFGCRADHFHAALANSQHSSKYLELLRFVRTNCHSALMDRKAYGWLAGGGTEMMEKFRGYIPWWLLENPEELLQVSPDDMFILARRTDTARSDTDAWFAAQKLGIQTVGLDQFNPTKKQRGQPRQLAPLPVSGSSINIELKPDIVNNDEVIAALRSSNSSSLKGGLEPIR